LLIELIISFLILLILSPVRFSPHETKREQAAGQGDGAEKVKETIVEKRILRRHKPPTRHVTRHVIQNFTTIHATPRHALRHTKLHNSKMNNELQWKNEEARIELYVANQTFD
jgi:hypothetical protein